MTPQLELDSIRIQKYQALKTNLVAVAEHFRHGDILVKAVNDTLAETQQLIDSGGETAFSKEDFNTMLDLRNEVLSPIFQNASFAAHFDYYSALKDANPEPVVPPEPVPDVVATTVEDQVFNGTLQSSTTITTVNSQITKTIKTIFGGGNVIEVITTEYSGGIVFKTSDVRFDLGSEIYKTESLISGSSVQVTATNYENKVPVSNTITTYEAGVITGSETITL